MGSDKETEKDLILSTLTLTRGRGQRGSDGQRSRDKRNQRGMGGVRVKTDGSSLGVGSEETPGTRQERVTGWA